MDCANSFTLTTELFVSELFVNERLEKRKLFMFLFVLNFPVCVFVNKWMGEAFFLSIHWLNKVERGKERVATNRCFDWIKMIEREKVKERKRALRWLEGGAGSSDGGAEGDVLEWTGHLSPGKPSKVSALLTWWALGVLRCELESKTVTVRERVAEKEWERGRNIKIMREV